MATAPIGWTPHGVRNWSVYGTNGVTPDTLVGGDHLLGSFCTKDEWDYITGDVDFQVDISNTLEQGAWDKGGISLFLDDTDIDKNYVVNWYVSTAANMVYILLTRDCHRGGGYGTVIGESYVSVPDTTPTSFTLRVTRISGIWRMYINGTDTGFNETDNTYTTGKFGAIYPDKEEIGSPNWDNFIVSGGGTPPPSTGRVFLIT